MKINVKKTPFIFNRYNNLHNNKFSQLGVLWDYDFKNLRGSKGSPQLGYLPIKPIKPIFWGKI
jgi:hypothetical protein